MSYQAEVVHGVSSLSFLSSALASVLGKFLVPGEKGKTGSRMWCIPRPGGRGLATPRSLFASRYFERFTPTNSAADSRKWQISP